MKMKTLKEVIEDVKKVDDYNGLNTEIKVYVTSTNINNERKTIIINPDSKNFIDRLGMVGFEDCKVHDVSRLRYSGKDHLVIIIINLDNQHGDDKNES
jgi:hypothetical protein